MCFMFFFLDLEPKKEYEVRVLAGTRRGFPALEDRDNRHWPWVAQITDSESKGGECMYTRTTRSTGKRSPLTPSLPRHPLIFKLCIPYNLPPFLL